MVGPGRYTVTLSKWHDGKAAKLAGPVDLNVVPMRKSGALPGAKPQVVAAFWNRIATLSRSVSAASQSIKEADARMKKLQEALDRSRSAPEALDAELEQLRTTLDDLRKALFGDSNKGVMGKAEPHTVSARLNFAAEGTRDSTYGPTHDHNKSIELAEKGFSDVRRKLNRLLLEQLPAFEKRLRDAGAPWSTGQPIP